MVRRISRNVREQIIELAEAGETQASIAMTVGCAPSTVRKYAQQVGILIGAAHSLDRVESLEARLPDLDD